jgi:MoaA/NifB/PqqE/SkfB family radical SAM enzyme
VISPAGTAGQKRCPSGNPELSTGEAGRLLDRLAAFDSPAIHLVLTGGDPLKRPDLFELIERGRMKGLGSQWRPAAPRS